MASEPKTTIARGKSSAKTSASKAVKKAPSKAAAPAKAATTTKAEKPVAKSPATSRKPKPTGQPIAASARLQHIEIAAYFLAEKSGFSRDPADCWIAAEREVDGLLLAGKL